VRGWLGRLHRSFICPPWEGGWGDSCQIERFLALQRAGAQLDSRLFAPFAGHVCSDTLWPMGAGRSTRLPFVASSCRLLLHLPSTHPFPRFLPVPCPDTSQVHRTYARWALTYTMMPPESISCANLVENLLASQNRIEPYHYRAHRGFS